MKQRIFIPVLLILLFCGAMLYGQDSIQIATLPFKGVSPELSDQFYRIFLQELPLVGNYTAFPVRMTHLPPDVPAGGYPPYICPSPSITGTAPYAITGELDISEDTPGATILRLYLWEMERSRPVYFDSLVAMDLADYLQNLPPLLRWILSWLPKKEPPPEVVEAPEEPPPPPPPPPVKPPPAPKKTPEHWLYVGIRGGTSLRFYDRDNAGPFNETHTAYGYNFNGAFHLSVRVFPILDIQPEVIYSIDRAPFTADEPDPADPTKMIEKDYPFSGKFLAVPLLLKVSLRQGPLSAGVLGGPYMIFPLGQINNEKLGGDFDYDDKLPWGYTVGINLGAKVGPGNIFLDIRWSADLANVKTSLGDELFKRSGITFNIGYEVGFIKKK